MYDVLLLTCILILTYYFHSALDSLTDSQKISNPLTSPTTVQANLLVCLAPAAPLLLPTPQEEHEEQAYFAPLTLLFPRSVEMVPSTSLMSNKNSIQAEGSRPLLLSLP